MSLTSISFVLCFFPAVLALYHVVRDKAREYVLVAISLLFYALCSPDYLLLFVSMLATALVFGRWIVSIPAGTTRRIVLFIGILLQISFLGYYKYRDFFFSMQANPAVGEDTLRSVILPLGISFFTFKAISYLVDIESGKIVVEADVIHDALYLSFWGHIISGPLARYNDMTPADSSETRKNLFVDGVYRFIIGFNKKILLANNLGNITSEVFATPIENLSTPMAWLGSVCYSLQLLFDFAGYSDMAIGITEMFGYPCRENFRFPYMTKSVSEFWRRWHISLGEWFRDYVYIPLGGSRCKNVVRLCFNLLVVWILTGIWHGSTWNFVVWGLAYFALITFEKITGLPVRLKTRAGQLCYRLFSLLFINFQWVLFRAEGLKIGLRFIKRMLILQNDPVGEMRALFLIKDYAFFIFVSLILCVPIVRWCDDKTSEKAMISAAWHILIYAISGFAFLWALSFVVAGQNNPFAYANF